MNAVHPLTYHLVKAEEAHRLARLERRARISADEQATHHDVVHHPSPTPVKRRSFVPRAIAVAVTTIALVLGLVVGGALANSGGGGGGGGATRISLQ